LDRPANRDLSYNPKELEGMGNGRRRRAFLFPGNFGMKPRYFIDAPPNLVDVYVGQQRTAARCSPRSRGMKV